MKMCLIVLILKMTCESLQEYMLNCVIKLIKCEDIDPFKRICLAV